jgi:flavocytochrome c
MRRFCLLLLVIASLQLRGSSGVRFAQSTEESSAQAVPAITSDVIIVGAGIAGLSAALEAARGGANVTVVDMSSVFGGHAVMSEGTVCLIGTPEQKASGIADSPELAEKDFIRWGEDPDPYWVHYYVYHSRSDVYDWVEAMGIRFSGVTQLPGNSVARGHNTRGSGLGLVSPIYRACLKTQRIRFVWNVKATELLRDGDRIAGVRGRNLRTNEIQDFRGKAVILATGGFQNNLDMVREFWPHDVPFPERILMGSGVNSVGSGHQIARAVGAVYFNMDHQWNYAYGLPDPRDPTLRRGLNVQIKNAIWVNSGGHRFVDETSGPRPAMVALLQQKPATYWAIFDSEAKLGFWVSGSDWGEFSYVQKWIFDDPRLVKSANTIEELAEKSGLPTAALEQTVSRYNKMIADGADSEFHSFEKNSNEKPPKISQPPFYTVQIFPLSRKSMGGIRIDHSCRVVDRNGRPIPGLYAAGELAGFGGINGKAGLEGTFLGPGILTGRVAGKNAALKIGASQRAATAVPSTAKSDIPGKAANSECLSCHDVATEVTKHAPGSAHFEAAHRVVLERNYQCVACHYIPMPFDAETHRIDPVAQIENCKMCHVAR